MHNFGEKSDILKCPADKIKKENFNLNENKCRKDSTDRLLLNYILSWLLIKFRVKVTKVNRLP